MPLLKHGEIKKAVKAAGKKTGKDFLATFEDLVAARLTAAITEHNGGRKTLDAGVAKLVFGGR